MPEPRPTAEALTVADALTTGDRLYALVPDKVVTLRFYLVSDRWTKNRNTFRDTVRAAATDHHIRNVITPALGTWKKRRTVVTVSSTWARLRDFLTAIDPT